MDFTTTLANSLLPNFVKCTLLGRCSSFILGVTNACKSLMKTLFFFISLRATLL